MSGPPLPPGWEARWDKNQGAYFFIDHSTKQTTWIDPRISMLLNQTSTNHSSDRDIPLSIYQSGEERNSTQGRELTTAFPVKHPAPDNNAKLEASVNALMKSHPGSTYDIVKEVLMGCNNNHSKAKETLELMGYRMKTEGGATSATRQTTPAQKSPAKKANNKSPAKKSSPPKEAVSEQEKMKIKVRLVGAFPDLEANIIDMALDICHHNEGKCRTLLKGWNDRKAPEMSGRSKTSDSGFSSRPTTALSTEPVSMDMNAGLPASFGADPHERPKSSPKKSAQSHGGRSRTPDQRPSTSKSRQTRAKTAQKSRHVDTMVTRQPYTQSEFRTAALGPDPGLRKGPDDSLLITDYVVALGPDPELRVGPDPSRLGERVIAMGPNPELVHGPMYSRNPMSFTISAV
ncbi:uncharacterized protein LOC125678839 isoform X2 [Ostrea edulis]|uniref:uncharacterized protein LOC125678839 isoform X2 n=1 Tax=Ostrea edulis TaxID=37623 RepID=UPI0024AEDA6C|nr:uncharacterized protein LOC125678839 isoform X2 [Ostrea edulis]